MALILCTGSRQAKGWLPWTLAGQPSEAEPTAARPSASLQVAWHGSGSVVTCCGPSNESKALAESAGIAGRTVAARAP